MRKNISWVLAVIFILSSVGGCASSRLRLMDEELARPGTGLQKEGGQRIDGYLLQDGTKEEYKGWVRVVGEDSLSFWTKEKTIEPAEEEGYSTYERKPGPIFAISSVKALDIYSGNMAGTLGLVLLAVVSGWVIGFIASTTG